MDDLICCKLRNLRWNTLKDVREFQAKSWVVAVDILVKDDDSISLFVRLYNIDAMGASKNPTLLRMLANNAHDPQHIKPFIDMYEIRLFTGIRNVPIPQFSINGRVFTEGYVLVGFLMNTDNVRMTVSIVKKQSRFQQLLTSLTGLNNTLKWNVKPTIKLADGTFFAPFLKNEYSLNMNMYNNFKDVFDVKYCLNELLDVRLLYGCVDINSAVFTDHDMKSAADIMKTPDILIDTNQPFYRHEAKKRAKLMHDTIHEELMQVCWHPARISKLACNDVDALNTILD